MINEYINNFLLFFASRGMCSSYYCLLYLFVPPVVVILLSLMFGRKYLKKARRDGNFKNISWQQMEFIAAEVYKELGYKVKVKGGAHADGGIDLIAKRNGKKVLIQVKHYKGNVGVKIVREMMGVLVDNNEYSEVHLVTSSGYTKEAVLFANRNKQVKLLTGKQILSKMKK